MMSQETEMALLTHKVESLHEDMGEMKVVMRDVANALTKLALIDERQANMLEAQERIFNLIERLDNRVDNLEKEDGKQSLATGWVYAAVWGAAGLLAMYVAKMLGLV
jgi:hypothetical protein